MLDFLLSATWISAQNMVEGVIYPGYAWVGSQNKVYVASGYTGAPYSQRTQIYDPVNDSWATGANVISPMWVLTGAYVGDTFYVFGGEDPYGIGYSNDNRKYDIPADLWFLGTPLPAARAGLGAAEFGGKIYIAGGYDNCGLFSCNVYNTTWEYDPTTGVYTTKSGLPTSLAEGVLITSEPFASIGLFYVPGYTAVSFGLPSLTRTIYYYDPVSDSWSSVGDYPTPARYQLGAVFMPDTSIWVIGGADASASTYANVDRCDLSLSPMSCNWTSYNPPDLPAGRDALIVTLADTSLPRPTDSSTVYDSLNCRIIVNLDTVWARRRILVAGGSDGSFPRSEAWTLVPDTLDVYYYVSGASSTPVIRTYLRNSSPSPGFFGGISDTITVNTGDTLCLDSLVIRERETGFRYSPTITSACISCVLGTGDENLGVGERKTEPNTPYLLRGGVLSVKGRVEVYSPDGRLVRVVRDGRTLLKPGIYFLRIRGKVYRITVR